MRRPWMSIERFSTSPFRKSACVADWKNFGDEASSPLATNASTSTVATTMAKGRMRGASVLRDGEGERAGAVDRVVQGNFPLAERRALHRVEVAAVAVAFEYAEHRRRQRREQLAVDDRARLRGEQLDVERVAASRLV